MTKKKSKIAKQSLSDKRIPRGDISLLTQPQTGSTRYQLMAWRAGYGSAAEYNFNNRRGGD